MAIHRKDWIEVNGVCLRYALQGGTVPDTVVLMHEMGGSIESWDEVVPLLENGVQVLRFDQRGFGLSEKSRDISLETQVADLTALLDALGLTGPVNFAGAALSSAACLKFALDHPVRVKSLVLSSPATGALGPAARAEIEARLERVHQGGMRAVTDTMFQRTWPPALRADRESQERFQRHRNRWMCIDPESFIAINRMVADFDLLGDLSRLNCPALIIGCSHDAVRPPARSAEIARLIPGAQYVEAESGHFMPIQTPALFAAHLNRFLSRNAG